MDYLKIIKNTKFHLVVIAILTILTYSNIFQNQLVIDDETFINNWPEIRNLSSWSSLIDSSLPPNTVGGYRPVRNILLSVYWHVWGSSPVGYHIHSILVHLISTILVYLILEKIFSKKPEALFGALLFGLHPVHVESITYISASMDTTGIMLGLAAFYFHLLKKLGKYNAWFWASIFFLLLAFLTDEMSFTIPFLIVLYDFYSENWDFKKFKKQRLIPHFWYFGLLVTFVAVRVFLIGAGLTRGGDYIAESFYHTMIVMPKMFVWYIWLLFVPWNLSYIHTIAKGFETYMAPYTHFESILSKSFFDADILGSIIILTAILVSIMIWRRKWPLITLSVLWFFISMLPVSYLIPVGPALSERYLYLSSIGFIILVCFLFAYLWKYVKWRTLTIVFALGLVIFYGVRTYARNFDWKNPESLYLSILREYPKSLIASYHLGVYYSNTLDWENAERAYQRVLLIEPKFYEARFNLANTYSKLGKLDQAEKEYMKIHQTAPNFLDAYINLGILYGKEGKQDQEIAQLQQGLTIDPTKYEILGIRKSQAEIITKFAFIHSLLGHLYEKKNDPSLAAQHYAKALQLDPSLTDAQAGLDALVSKNPSIKNVLPANSLLGYKTSFGLVFRYPAVWKIHDQGEKVVLENEKGNFFVQLQVEQMPQQESADQFLTSRETLGTLVNQGSAKIPNFDYAYVKIWTTDQNIQKYQFFLFKGNKALEVIAFPIDTTFIKEDFDSFISSMKME